ncbi:hypothetical protein A3C25_05235 [Candidatus Roizmanbacteria bacterium RIFCSPHIGHO2_02_FULL_38_11]|uniref:Serine aminopeptidase S33 domain-containing protein n=1 Tax=Candidatus Roizmanbacteria bacterium RIFCSPHIGHO2_02_FULL_38_11 TaxID=1802039 RepID=A0A1F7GZX2_9BACT|nr:MAG: hypothetical protein A3C25_05235 [Candidatus Roizmanbacteria bacterium RIFCSPHIGHO2_02_FULL_38_11]
MFRKPSGVNISIHKIYSEDALELDALLFEAEKSSAKIIIHLHGKEGHFIQNHFVTVMGYTYPLHGYSFLTFNNRGHDYISDMLKKASHGFEWVTRGSAYEIIEEAIYDINGVIDYVKNLGYKEIILQGHSLGPHKICYYLGNNPKHEIKKIILITTADILYQLNSSVKNWKEYSGVAKEMISEGKGDRLMPIKLWSNAPVSARTFWHYTNSQSNAWVFNFTNPSLEFKNLDKVTLPTLAVVPETDVATGVPQEKAMKLLKQKIASKDFTSVIIQNAVHNFASKEKELVNEIVSWLNK